MEQLAHTSLVQERAIIDIHICGACRTEFNDVHVFLQHKTDGCGRVTTATTNETHPLEPQVIMEVPCEPQDRSQNRKEYQPIAENLIGQSVQLLTNQVEQGKSQENQPQQSMLHVVSQAPQQTSSSDNMGKFEPVSVVSATAHFQTPPAQTISTIYPLASHDDLEENVKNAGEILANLHNNTLRAAAMQGGQGVLNSTFQNAAMDASKFQRSNSEGIDTSTILTLEPVNDDDQISATNLELFPLQNTNTDMPVQGALCTSASQTVSMVPVNDSVINSVASQGITNIHPNTTHHMNQTNVAGNLQHLILQPTNLPDGNFTTINPVETSKDNQGSLPLGLSLNSTESGQNAAMVRLFGSPHLQSVDSVAGVMSPESQQNFNPVMQPNSVVSNMFAANSSIQGVNLGKRPTMLSDKKQPRQTIPYRYSVSVAAPVSTKGTPYVTYPGSVKKPRTRPVAVKKFHCDFEGCNFTTAYLKDLDRHKRTHTGERPFSCEYCRKTFNRNDKLKIHLRGHTGEKPYKCQMCEYASADSSSLKKHIRTHTGERPFKCQVCQYASRNSSQLIVHLRSHTGDSPFQCQQCDAKFKINTDLKRHMRTHTGEKPYACDMCEYKCSVKSNLNSHKKVNHSAESNLRCEVCDFKTSSKKAHKEHLKIHGTDGRPEQCQACGYVCANKTALKNHMLTHDTNKPFKCDSCSYSSKQLGNVKTHTRKKHPELFRVKKSKKLSAKKEKECQAAVVPDEFSTTRQKRLPMCRKGFNCTECSASFVREDSLRSHLKQHKENATIESMALAVLQLRNPVIAPNNIAGNTLPIEQPSQVDTHRPLLQHTKASEAQTQFSNTKTVSQEMPTVTPSFSQEGLVVTPFSQPQIVPENLTLQATPNSYIYSVPHSNVTVVPSSTSSVASTQQQAQQVITGPIHVVPTSVGMSTNQAAQGQNNQAPLHARVVQSSVQLFSGLQYPVIRLTGGQFFPESQMIGTQIITNQGGENFVTVLGTPMTNFIGQLPVESVQQLPAAAGLQQSALQAQQHLEHQQPQQFQIQAQDLHQQKATHDQPQQYFATSDSVISADPNTGAIPFSIQFVPQRLSSMQSAEMGATGMQLSTGVNLETLAQVVDHPLATNQGTVQVLLPSGTTDNPQVISSQPNVLVHMAGVRPGGDNPSFPVQSGVVPVHLVQNREVVEDTNFKTDYKTAEETVIRNQDGNTGSANNNDSRGNGGLSEEINPVHFFDPMVCHS